MLNAKTEIALKGTDFDVWLHYVVEYEDMIRIVVWRNDRGEDESGAVEVFRFTADEFARFILQGVG